VPPVNTTAMRGMPESYGTARLRRTD
jgi:hypothetical protein